MSHRLFAAIRPPEEMRDALIDTMEALDGARWQDEEQLHLTLRFIGEVDRHTAEDVADALSRIRMEPFPLLIDGVGHFERKGVPHAIWARVEPSRELIELQKSVEQACRGAGVEGETRRFTPHITIARLNRSSGDIAPWLARHADLKLGPWQAEHFSLYRSHLSKHGSTYEKIADFPVR